MHTQHDHITTTNPRVHASLARPHSFALRQQSFTPDCDSIDVSRKRA